MIYFTAHTFKCVCHCRRAMFRVLGMYNFANRMDFLSKIVKQAGFLLLVKGNFEKLVNIMILTINLTVLV